MTTTSRVLYEHEWRIEVIVRRGRILAAEYIEGLPLPDRTRVEAFLDRVSRTGPPANIEKSRKIDRDLWELKSVQARLPYFMHGRCRLVITHGFTKKQPKLPRTELERARALRAEYLAEL